LKLQKKVVQRIPLARLKIYSAYLVLPWLPPPPKKKKLPNVVLEQLIPQDATNDSMRMIVVDFALFCGGEKAPFISFSYGREWGSHLPIRVQIGSEISSKIEGRQKCSDGCFSI